LSVYIHLIAAIWLLLSGIAQIFLSKGTKLHKVTGWTWMIAMLVVAISSFWISGFVDWIYGYGPLHLLSIWVIVCVIVALVSVKRGNIRLHKAYTLGAFLGSIGAAIAALLIPNRLLYDFFFT